MTLEASRIGRSAALLVASLGLGIAASAPAAAQLCTPAAPDLVAWWPGDGDAADYLSSHDGTLQGGASFAPGMVATGGGDGFWFDGVDDYVSVPASPELAMTSAYTLEAWIESTGGSDRYRVIAVRTNGGANDIEVYIQKTSNDLIVAHNRYNGGGFDYVGFQDPPSGAFHLAVTFDGTEVHAYYDGVEALPVQRDRSVVAPLYTNKGWEIGRTTVFSPARFAGSIDELALYERALAQAEIQAIVAAGSAGRCKDADDDGLTDDEELALGTDPNLPDTDFDGLLDGTEIDLAAGGACPDPLLADSDADSLGDGLETDAGTDPCASDSDLDGIPDDLDPFPLDPSGTTGYVEAQLRELAGEIASLDPALFTGKNRNANRGRRGALANRAHAAADAVAELDFATALEVLASLAVRMDDEARPKDWISVCPERDAIVEDLDALIVLLGLL